MLSSISFPSLAFSFADNITSSAFLLSRHSAHISEHLSFRAPPPFHRLSSLFSATVQDARANSVHPKIGAVALDVLETLSILTLLTQLLGYLDVAWRNQLFPFSNPFRAFTKRTEPRPGSQEWWAQQVVVVTGGGGGLGGEVVKLVHDRGARVVSLDVKHRDDAASSQLTSKGSQRCKQIDVDLRKLDDLHKAHAEIRAEVSLR